MNVHKITTKHLENFAFESEIDVFKFKMDSAEVPTGNGAPSPKKLMLSALAGCTGIDVVSILQKMQVDFTDFSIDIEATLTEEHPKIYNNVSIVYSIKVLEINTPKVERAVQLSKEKYCGVSAMFGYFAQIDWKINFL
jgi:putative redox protein